MRFCSLMICRLYDSPQHDLVHKPQTLYNTFLLEGRMHQMWRDFPSVMKVWGLIKREITLGDEGPDLTKPALQRRAQASPEIRESPGSLKEASSQELYCYKEMDCVTWTNSKNPRFRWIQTCKALSRGSDQTLTRFLTHRNCETNMSCSRAASLR